MELFIILTAVIATAVLIETSIILARVNGKTHTTARRKIYVDTSALMDGRILAIAKTGFLGGELLIPRSVIREMQLLADGKDSEKRSRARFGMDVANELTNADYIKATVIQDKLDHTPVDERLLELAKANGGEIITNDYNLSKVATTEKIKILSVNELALVLRAEFLPGESFMLRINAVGSNPNQGIGYLPDGTMVVVDNASKLVGKDIRVEFVRFIQTSAGRMMFGRPVTEIKHTVKKPNMRKPVGKKAMTPKKETKKPIKKRVPKKHRTAEDRLLDAARQSEN